MNPYRIVFFALAFAYPSGGFPSVLLDMPFAFGNGESMGDTDEEIELREGESGYICEGQIYISPEEIGIDQVIVRIGRKESSVHESKVRVGRSIKLNAGPIGQYKVTLLGIGEGSFERDVSASARFSVTRL